MCLSICSQRDVRRILVLLVAISFTAHIYAIAASASSQRDAAQHDWPGRGWRVAIEIARKLLPISHNDTLPKSEPNAKQMTFTLDRGNERMNATFVSLARNSELPELLRSIQDVEDRFNQNWHYDWVFLNDEDFTEEFKVATTAAVSGRVRYGKVGAEHWSFPDFIDSQRAQTAREEMKDVKYGDSISYRHMCRYQSGFFYRHPLVLEYDWYWRVEPSIELFCDIPYDPFRWMAENGKKYSFVLSPNELKETVPSLWGHVRGFMEAYPEHINGDNHLHFLSEDGGQTSNYCHFWSNFEIASLEWFRSDAYNDFFNYLDSAGGFFYERWGDASVHSIAAALLLKKGEIHFFDDIGYRHSPYNNCPRSPQKRLNQKCRCSADDNMEWAPSCKSIV
jgi:alpha 1,2-mannosyltransferase